MEELYELHLPYISRISPVYLPYISPIPPYISPTQVRHMEELCELVEGVVARLQAVHP